MPYCWHKMSEKNLEQKTNIKFCVKIGNISSKMLVLLKTAYGEHAIKKLSSKEMRQSRKAF